MLRHAPRANVPGQRESTYFHAPYAVDAAPVQYQATQSVDAGAGIPVHWAVTFVAVTAVGGRSEKTGCATAARRTEKRKSAEARCAIPTRRIQDGEKLVKGTSHRFFKT